MNLIEIGKKYPSSKNISGFIQLYEKYFSSFRNSKINILEIGVDNGDSLRIWREYFTNANICGIDILKKDFKIDNTEILQGDQSDKNFLSTIIQKYKNFDIIIDDGSHLKKDVIKSFHLLFPYLNNEGLYVVEDMQTSYNHFFGGNPFDLKYSNSHMNFFKHLTDRLNYQEIANPFYISNKYDAKIINISFYRNLVFVRKGVNDILSKEVINHSYEDMKFNEKSSRTGNSFKYYLKYKIFYKTYTFLLMIINMIKRLILLRF